MTWRHDDAHSRRILAPKNRAIDDPDVLAAFARAHWFCQVCGLDGDCQIHHIIGGRGGRSDEECNLLYSCPRPCHLEWADHSANLPIVLTMKLRAGEMTAADANRLEVLHGRNLPDFAAIPIEMIEQYERNRRHAISRQANYVHCWSRMNPDTIAAIRPL